ncbi:hypothetical protein JB92DRAFT_1315083 [Gautieria morchelliformis]|nr:hypothetical protein JB92DRAFT_1315083 [Gautieria morchelliformis]
MCEDEDDRPSIRVNLRYAFQDDENGFFVLDLMLGGIYHGWGRLDRLPLPLSNARVRKVCHMLRDHGTLTTRTLQPQASKQCQNNYH